MRRQPIDTYVARLDAEVRTAELRRLWKEARAVNPDAKDYTLAEGIQIDKALIYKHHH